MKNLSILIIAALALLALYTADQYRTMCGPRDWGLRFGSVFRVYGC
jgi:hypothetical protein